jgi:hypothetical protein
MRLERGIGGRGAESQCRAVGGVRCRSLQDAASRRREWMIRIECIESIVAMRVDESSVDGERIGRRGRVCESHSSSEPSAIAR